MLSNREVNAILAPVYAEMLARDLVIDIAETIPSIYRQSPPNVRTKQYKHNLCLRGVYLRVAQACSLNIGPAEFEGEVSAMCDDYLSYYVDGFNRLDRLVNQWLPDVIEYIRPVVIEWSYPTLPRAARTVLQYLTDMLPRDLEAAMHTIPAPPARPVPPSQGPPTRTAPVRVCPVQAALARREQRAREAAAAVAKSDVAYSDLLREADAHLRNKRFKAKKQAARKAAAARKQAAKPPPYGGPSRGRAASDDDEPAPPPPY